MTDFFESIVELDIDRQTINTGEEGFNKNDDERIVAEARDAFCNNIALLYIETNNRINELMNSCNVDHVVDSPKEEVTEIIPELADDAEKMDTNEVAVHADNYDDLTTNETADLVDSFMGNPTPLVIAKDPNIDDPAGKIYKLTTIKFRQAKILKQFSCILEEYFNHHKQLCESTREFITPADIEKFDNMYRAFRRYSQVILCKAVALVKCNSELDRVAAGLMKTTMTEASGNVDVSAYIAQLNKLVPEIREFYDTYKHKELLTPRKKHLDKMEDYVRGAIERKYTLKIPIYKVTGNSPDVCKLIKETFIPTLRKILAKYNNFTLLSPDMGYGTDLFIYITLQEPFGSNEPKEGKIREEQDKKELLSEAAGKLSAEERKNLADSDFGIPEKRAYPLHDKEHIQKAIQFFSFAKPADKEQLAKSIANAIVKQGLVGEIKIGKNNRSAKYFPAWLQEDQEPVLKKSKKENIVMLGKEKVWSTVTESVSDEIPYILFDDNGKLL